MLFCKCLSHNTDATAAARLKNSLQLTKTTFPQPTPPLSGSVALYGNDYPSENTPVSQHDFVILKQQMQTMQRQLYRKQQVPNSADFRPLRTRNSRTTDRRPICNNCNRFGHYSSRCYSNQNRQSFQGNSLPEKHQPFRPASNFQPCSAIQL